VLAFPNVSEGRDPIALLDIQEAMTAVARVELVAMTFDPDHNRAVIVLHGPPDALVEAIVIGAREAVARIDLRTHEGAHPRLGALDVAPFVHLDADEREPALAAARDAARRIGDEAGVPVFLYGEPAGGRTPAELRRGGLEALARRLRDGELAPDAGPAAVDPATGAVLVTARPQLAGLDFDLGPEHTLADARAIAALIREGGDEGLASVRALGLELPLRGAVQVSTMIENPWRTSARDVLAAIARHARMTRAELVAPAPAATLADWPADVPLEGSSFAKL
jgi:glutamate formiminotransferase / 5-formyltetrahydrofolate cyclo-ligase